VSNACVFRQIVVVVVVAFGPVVCTNWNEETIASGCSCVVGEHVCEWVMVLDKVYVGRLDAVDMVGIAAMGSQSPRGDIVAQTFAGMTVACSSNGYCGYLWGLAL